MKRTACDFCGEIPHSKDPRYSVHLQQNEDGRALMELPHDLCRYCYGDLRAEIERKVRK